MLVDVEGESLAKVHDRDRDHDHHHAFCEDDRDRDHDHDHSHCKGGHGHKHSHSHCEDDHGHEHSHSHSDAHLQSTNSGCCEHSHASGWRAYLPHSHALSARLAADARTLFAALAILMGACATQVIAGLASGSGALAAEAVHSALDGLTIVLSLVAAVVAGRPPTPEYPYGYGRAEVVAAAASIAALALLCVKLAVGALHKLWLLASGMPVRPVGGAIVFGAEAVTLVANVAMATVLTRRGGGGGHGEKASLNIRALRAHVIADSVENVVVLGAGALIWAVPGVGAVLDPVLTLCIAVLLAYLNADLAREALRALLQAAPVSMQLGTLQTSLSRLPGVRAVPALRAWALTSDVAVVEATVEVAPETAEAATDRVRRAVRRACAAAGGALVTVEVRWGARGEGETRSDLEAGVAVAVAGKKATFSLESSESGDDGEETENARLLDEEV